MVLSIYFQVSLVYQIKFYWGGQIIYLLKCQNFLSLELGLCFDYSMLLMDQMISDVFVEFLFYIFYGLCFIIIVVNFLEGLQYSECIWFLKVSEIQIKYY